MHAKCSPGNDGCLGRQTAEYSTGDRTALLQAACGCNLNGYWGLQPQSQQQYIGPHTSKGFNMCPAHVSQMPRLEVWRMKMIAGSVPWEASHSWQRCLHQQGAASQEETPRMPHTVDGATETGIWCPHTGHCTFYGIQQILYWWATIATASQP